MTRISALACSLLALAATPALAQDADLCGGAGATGQWIGGTEAMSDISTAPAYLEQLALVLPRNEFVSLFTLSQPGEVRIEAAGQGGGDTVIDIRDATGNIVISDDDGGGGTDSRAETSLQPGTYCVSLRSFDGSPMTGFVRVGPPDHEALTPGIGEMPDPVVDPVMSSECDLAQAQPLTLGGQATNPVDAVPFYSLTLNAPTALTLTAENQEADPVLTLYDDGGNWLDENDDWDGMNSRIDMEAPLSPGTYCIALRALNDSSLPVTVAASEYDAQSVMMDLYARGDASPPMDGSYPITDLGDVAARVRQDANVGGDAVWYSVDVNEGGLLLIEAIAQGQGDPALIMYDDLGRQIGYNDDAEGTLNSMLTVRVHPGTYLFAVRQIDSSMQGFIRLVVERYVPAQ